MKKVAVVILNWNGKKLLEQFLPSIIQHTDTNLAEIIVADNNSDDDSCIFIEQSYPQINIIRLSENYGYAGGYNKALEKLNNEYYVLLNSDVEVTSNWLQPLVEYLDNNAGTAGVQPKILSQRNKKLFEYAGACGGFIDKWGYPFCRGRIFDCIESDHSQYDIPIDILWASGACLVIRSSDFWNIGGFDAIFFAHMEEIDLCWRLNAKGRKLVCIPQSVVFHVGGATLNEESPKKTFLNFRNNLLMVYKNTTDKEFKKIYRYRKILDYLAAVQFLLVNKKKNAKAIIEAHQDFKKIKPKYQTEKDKNINIQEIKNILTIYNKSILINFFLKRINKFSDLKWK